MPAEVAKRKIQEDRPDIQVILVPVDSAVTDDFNTKRVRVFFDKAGNVAQKSWCADSPSRRRLPTSACLTPPRISTPAATALHARRESRRANRPPARPPASRSARPQRPPPSRRRRIALLPSCFSGPSNGGGEEEQEIDGKERFEFMVEPMAASSKDCVGTYEYLASELVSGSGYDNGVDRWAFDVFLYELVYGRTPFKSHTKVATLKNILSK
uniref:non-specific serine/threonine protein kinase n=1 Tax=Zea mays TaxID=4577 RepID=A0A804QPQ0_MAIZE